jgi:prevent-host-death family protein
MKRLNISEAKANLGRYVKQVQRGEAILLLERQRPVAKIVRLEIGDADEGSLAELEAAGVIKRASRPLKRDFFRRHQPAKAKSSVLAALIEERQNGDR